MALDVPCDASGVGAFVSQVFTENGIGGKIRQAEILVAIFADMIKMWEPPSVGNVASERCHRAVAVDEVEVDAFEYLLKAATCLKVDPHASCLTRNIQEQLLRGSRPGPGATFFVLHDDFCPHVRQSAVNAVGVGNDDDGLHSGLHDALEQSQERFRGA